MLFTSLTTPRPMPVWSRVYPRPRTVTGPLVICTSGGQSSGPMCGSPMWHRMLTYLMTHLVGRRTCPTRHWKVLVPGGCLSFSRTFDRGFGCRTRPTDPLCGDPISGCPSAGDGVGGKVLVAMVPTRPARWTARPMVGTAAPPAVRKGLGSKAWTRDQSMCVSRIKTKIVTTVLEVRPEPVRALREELWQFWFLFQLRQSL